MANKIKNSKILVTGGAGFIGSHIVDLLIKEGAGKVIAFDDFSRGHEENLEEAMKSGRVEIFKGDIRDTKALMSAFKGVDYVFHQAALWFLDCENDPRKAIDVNIIGTFNICEACVNAGVKKLIAASSSSVYGEGEYLPTDEKHPLNNYLFYGVTKIANEHLYRSFYKKHGLDYIAFRYLNVYGPRMDWMSPYVMVIMKFLNNIDKGKPPVIQGDGSATMDLIYVEDIARENILALESDITNECFNGASGKETSLKELLDLILKLTGSKLQPIYESRDSRLIARRLGCPKKSKEMLGFEAVVPLEEGLKRVILWREKQIAKQNKK